MRRILLTIPLLACHVCGCASQRHATSPTTATTAAATFDENDAIVASALLFDPPVIANQPLPDLGRADRELAAFAGYDQALTTYFYLRTDDRQEFFDNDRGQFGRRAVSETFGVRSH